MIFEHISSPAKFLELTQGAFEKHEVEHIQMLGAAPLGDSPQHYSAVVRFQQRLVAVFLMAEPSSKLVVYVAANSEDVMEVALEMAVRDLAARGIPMPGVTGPAEACLCFAKVWTEATGRTSHVEARELLSYLHEASLAVCTSNGRMVKGSAENLPLVSDWLHAFALEAIPWHSFSRDAARLYALEQITAGNLYLWLDENGIPVSMAAKVRQTQQCGCIGTVYTPPLYRGKGFGTAVTASLARRLLQVELKSSICLFADVTNSASKAIYQKLGFRAVLTIDTVVFR
jgi:RimJ/RimL family protein N-acetyltransferase